MFNVKAALEGVQLYLLLLYFIQQLLFLFVFALEVFN